MKKVNQRLDLQAIESSAINPEMLDKIGAKNADMIIAVTNNDETNIFSCQLAAKFYNIQKKIARIRSTYLTNYIDKLKDLEYIDVIIDPAQLVTKRILRKIEHPATFVVLDFVSESLQVFSVKINYTCEIMGKSIAELKAKLSEIPYKLICIINDYASHEKEIQEGCNLNTIIVRDNTHKDGKVFMENYLHIIVLNLEKQIGQFDKENSIIMLIWVLGYFRFEKLREDKRNIKRSINNKI